MQLILSVERPQTLVPGSVAIGRPAGNLLELIALEAYFVALPDMS